MRVSLPKVYRRPHPPVLLGVLVALACLAVETGAGTLLEKAVPVQSIGVIYLVGLLIVTSIWGLPFGLAMAVVSTVVYDFFLTPPAWSLNLTRSDDAAVLGVFMALALLAFALARLARLLSAEVEARQEADITADIARLMLRAPELDTALPATGTRLADALGLPSASIEPDPVTVDERHVALPLHKDGMGAALVVPAGLSRPVMRRLRERVVPPLGVLLDAACERERVADDLRNSRDELARIAEEQAALRRLATLVAHAAPPSEVFHAVAREMGKILGTMHALVVRLEPDAGAVTVGTWNNRSDLDATMPLGSHWVLEKGTVSELVARTGAPGRIDVYEGDGPLVNRLRSRGIVSSVGCPIVVGRSLWGIAIASSSTSRLLPEGTEERMLEFTGLAAAAIANAQSNADLKASRARVVAAADEARRRIERDLHDGTQQRLVSLGLELRGVEDAMPPDHEDLRKQLSETAKSLEDTVADLQELSRGLHPAILAKGGLEPALLVLSRRSAVPVELDVSIGERLAHHFEVTLYYVISEALANAVKHASASLVRVTLVVTGDVIRLWVSDDGVGGADPSQGSGLLGLVDRVEVIGGQLTIVSPPGGGTTLQVEIPLVEPV